MATTVENGKGGVINVTDTAQLIRIVPAPGTDGAQKSAMTLKVNNVGSSNIFAAVNCDVADYVEADAIRIDPDKDHWFVGQPIKKLVVASGSGTTSTATYGAF